MKGLMVESPIFFAFLIIIILLAIIICGYNRGKNQGDRIYNIFLFAAGEDNRYSVSRLQMLLWTFVLLIAYLAVFFKTGFDLSVFSLENPDSLPKNILIILGISLGSFIGAKVITNSKLQRKGLTINSQKAEGPQFSDFFTAKEEGSDVYLDVSKLQMFVWTLIAIFTYLLALTEILSKTQIQGVPDIDRVMLYLMGISQSGYLAKKLIPEKMEDKN